jgi:protocatechuate 3,4-dioxygenase beta subunit
VRPALTEGPFFVDEKLNRSDIRSDPADGSLSPGLPLVLHFTVSKISGGACTSLEGAVVDVWHCDAEGRYSDEQQNRTLGKKFLRGYQTTDANGTASFTTIYPGWYTGRAVHIHFKIRTGSHDFTSQLFFDDALSDEVYTKAPYTGRGSRDRDMRNSDDGIYRQSRGQLLLEATREGNGLASRFGIALQL